VIVAFEQALPAASYAPVDACHVVGVAIATVFTVPLGVPSTIVTMLPSIVIIDPAKSREPGT
jgi:hypothetical protein